VDDEISCVSSTAKVKKGAQNIVVDNKPMAHVNAESDHGGKITQGSNNVFVGPRKPFNYTCSQIKNTVPVQKTKNIVVIDLNSNKTIVSQPSTWDYMIGLDTALWSGVKSIPKSLKLGTQEVGEMIGVAGINKFGDAWGAHLDLLKFILKSAKYGFKEINPLYKLIQLVLGEYYKILPDCALKAIAAKAGYGAAYMVGRSLIARKMLDFVTKSVTKKVLESLLKLEFFEELTSKVILSVVSADTVVGVLVTVVILESIVKESEDAAQRLHKQHPNIYQILKDEELIGGYFIVEKPLEPYLNAISKQAKSPVEFHQQTISRYCNGNNQ
jgi:hypothetical protein